MAKTEELHDILKIDPMLVRKMERQLQNVRFTRNENQLIYTSYTFIEQFYQAIRDNRVEDIPSILMDMDLSEGQSGVVSEDPLRNIKNLWIVFLTGISIRLVVDGWFDIETHSALGDVYLSEIEKAETELQATAIALAAFALAAKEITAKHNAIYHPLVRSAKEYIKQHIHQKIVIEEIAAKLDISPSYLSQIFKKGTGLTVKQYIMKKKVDHSKRLLEKSDFTIAEISALLGFATPSHFTREFSKIVHMTPSEYRFSHSM